MNFTGPTTPGGGSLPGVTVPLVSFYVDGPGSNVPVGGQTQLRVATLKGQSLVNKELLVINEQQELMYADSPAAPFQIKRYNDGTLGGFDFNTAVGPGSFVSGDRYDIFIVGINNTIDI